MLLLTNVLKNQWLMNTMFYKRKQISKLCYQCLVLEVFKSLLFEVVLKSLDYFSNLCPIRRIVMVAVSKTVPFVPRKMWLRAELCTLGSPLSSRPPVQVWTKSGNSPGVRFFIIRGRYQCLFSFPTSITGFLILAASRYTGLLREQLVQQEYNLN